MERERDDELVRLVVSERQRKGQLARGRRLWHEQHFHWRPIDVLVLAQLHGGQRAARGFEGQAVQVRVPLDARPLRDGRRGISRLDCLPRGNGGGRPGRCNRLAGGPGLLRDGGSRLLCRLGLRRWLCLLALLLGSSGLLGGLLHGRLGRCQDRLQDHTANDDHDRDHDCQESFPIHASLFPSLRGRDHTRRRERDGT